LDFSRKANINPVIGIKTGLIFSIIVDHLF
jgi:hypothetical protein